MAIDRNHKAPAWRASRAHWGTVTSEILLTSLLMVTYFFIRGMRPDDVDSSVQRSLHIIRFEQQVGVFWEVSWQQAFLGYGFLMQVANLIYAWGHYPVLLAIALWLVVKDPVRFRFVRNVMLVSSLIGIATYYLLPAAPPRLMENYGYDFGFIDTVHGAASDVNYFQPSPFVNDYAALPSFHFGWIALASAAIWVNTSNRYVRAGAVMMSVLMWWAVTVTGNHYFFDMVFGGVVVALSWWVVAGASRLRLREWAGARVRWRNGRRGVASE